MTEPERESGVVPEPEAAKARRLTKTDDPGRGMDGAPPQLGARVVVGVFEDHRRAEAAQRGLIDAGMHRDAISLVMQPPASAPETSADETLANERGAIGAAAGAALGAVAGLAALTIPGFGALLAAGPIVAALGGAAVGTALGGLVGSLGGLGIPTEDAREYEAAVRAGGSIVTITVGDEHEAARAEAELRRHQPRHVASYQESL